MFDYVRPRLRGWRCIPFIFWGCVALTFVVLIFLPGWDIGWDLRVYKNAMSAIQAGQDPYVSAMAVLRDFHSQEHPPGMSTPFCYVYPPLTLPLLAAAGKLPPLLNGIVYWSLTVFGVVTILLVNWRVVREQERKVFSFLLPAAVFFPAMVQADVIFSGNVAYILYGLVLGGAWLGWIRSRWIFFYLAVFIASCFKAPMLSLIAIAPLSAKKQWIPTGITVAAGLGAFVIQSHVWPSLFQHYLESIELQFSLNHDFGASPAGVIANALYGIVPYQFTSVVVYILSAVIFGALLFSMRRYFLDGRIHLRQWVPVMLCGVILLNPRVMEYDSATLTLMTALTLWRALEWSGSMRIRALVLAAFFVSLNIVGAMPDTGFFSWDRMAEAIVITGAFIVGCRDLMRRAEGNEPATTLESPVSIR
jgi:hypothetical protein